MKLAGLLMLSCLLLCAQARAQQSVDEEDLVEVSYIYAAIMGSGTFKINGRRVTTLNIPFYFTQREMTQEQAGIVWHAPVVLGYDAVSEHDWLGELLDDDLMTLSLLPGVEYQMQIDDTWAIKPFAHLGVTQDFSSGETIIMGTLGVRALGTFIREDGWEIRWGNAVRLAAEYQLDSHHRTSFGMWETGLDIRRDTPFLLAERRVDGGVYYRYQHFVPEWDIDRLRPRESDLGSVHEVGISMGLKRPFEIMRIDFDRVRVGYNWGSGSLRGWSVGTEFPF